jgi:uncharacterized integral membrane protein (TIGR00697 family)
MKDRKSEVFVALVVVYCVALTVSNIIAGKLWEVAPGLVLPTAVWLFPIVYIIDDIIPEVFGFETARRVILLGFAANLIAVLFFALCLVLPAPGYWTGQAAFETVLGFTPRLLLASFAAYLVGTNANAWVMVRLKQLTQGRWLWTRTIGSTLVGQFLDSSIFITIAFLGVVPTSVMATMILAQAGFKIAYEVLATPVTYWAVGLVRRYGYEGAR